MFKNLFASKGIDAPFVGAVCALLDEGCHHRTIPGAGRRLIGSLRCQCINNHLFHFLLLGLLLFLIFDLTATTRPAAGKTIVVDREKLLTHLQFRSKAFDTGQFETTLETTLETA